MCLSCSLPFYSIDDLEFHFIFGNFNRLPCDEVMDRLTQLKFNPLDFDNNIIITLDILKIICRKILIV